MLNKPKFMSPSINMYGNNVIDLNAETLPFSCIVDGNEPVVAWQIVVSRLSDNAVVFNTGKRTHGTPFSPINNRNQNVTFSIDLKKYFTGESDFKNSAEPFFWTITLWGSTGVATTSSGEVFYANSKPVVSIEETKSDLTLSPGAEHTLTKREASFKATYTQAENIQIKRYGWRLTDAISGVIVFDTITKNQIYGLQEDISCECTGLTNECRYVIELFIETQNGYFGVVQSAKFKVEYTVKDVEADFEISTLNESSAIMLNWGNLRTTEGLAHGEVNYVSRHPIVKENYASAVISDNSSIEFSSNANGKSLDIDEKSYIVLSFQFDKSMPRLLFEATGVDESSAVTTRRLKYMQNANNRTLDYTVTKGNITVYQSIPISDIIGERCWYIATLYPLQTDSSGEHYTTLKLVESIAEGGLFPGDAEYPTGDLYPYLGEWDKIKQTEG